MGIFRACLLLDDEIDLKGPLRESCGDEALEILIKKRLPVNPEDIRWL